jgi:3-phosphoshikimate 1-carboxyvinyltransferase
VNTLEITPVDKPVNADVTVPGSKSYTNRALLIAALADGVTTLTGALFSDDTKYMADSLRRLGIEVEEDPDSATFVVHGTGGRIPADTAELFVGGSGTCARFLSAFVALGNGRFVIDGVDRTRERPIQDLLTGLNGLGVDATSQNETGCPPVVVNADGIKGGRTFMPGDRSSQYFTALLLVAPYAQENTDIRVEGELASSPYIDMTLDIMRRFGVDVVNDDYNAFHVRAGQRYNGTTYAVEPDATNATYFMAAAAITGGRVTVKGLTEDSAQGDVRFARILEQMGCTVSVDDSGITVRGPDQLHGIDIDLNSMPDTAQTLWAIAPFASTAVTVRNVPVLRIHETDRIAAMENELTRLGVRVKAWGDGMTVYPASEILPTRLETYDDHRMAMSLALIGLREPGVILIDPDCVNKTFPDYFTVLDTLRA